MPVKISMTWLLGRIIYIAVYNKIIMGKNMVCSYVWCLWKKKPINLLLLGHQFCGSSVRCCSGTAEAVGGEVKGRFFKGEAISPKQHGAQPC